MNRDTLTARSSFSSTSSVSDAAGADWIAPAERPTQDVLPPDTRPKNRRISSALGIDEASELWLRMVELQERYGCYRSARMQAAVSAASPSDLMPSRVCLDLLNDDVADELPDEAWQILGRFVVEV
jgi:hypothetical protein